MSKRWGEGLATPGGARSRALRAARAVALAGGLSVVGVAGVGAQATPVGGGIAASPAAGTCEAPEGTATAGMGMASPEATPVTEEDGALPVGTPVDDQDVIDQATAAAENFANCWNAGDVEAVAGLVTANFLGAEFGFASAEEAAEGLGGMDPLPPISPIETGDVQTYEDGRASLDLVYLLGDHQYTAARWYMVEADGQLLIDEQELTLPQPDVETTTVLGMTFADDETAIAFDAPTDAETGAREIALLPGIVLTVSNAEGTEARYVSIVRLDDEAAATPVAGDLPEGEFVAMFAVPAGDNADVALVNLTPGGYAVGEMDGEAVALTITEPVEG